jgi:hypothetical protein
MPVKIIKMYKGTNIFKGLGAGTRLKYGYRWCHEGRKYTRPGKGQLAYQF